MNDLRKAQESFARKAQAHPTHRFGDLYHLICRQDWLGEALRAVLSHPGSRTAGVDGISRKHLADEPAQAAFVETLRTELKSGTYHPRPARRRWVPKANGQQRPLGIPTLKDRVVQMALKMLLEPIWESDFLECSNGFRPGRRAMDCVRVCATHITTRNKYLWVIEGDIQGCFDHVHHTTLLKLVRRRVKDERVVALIAAMLKAGIMADGIFQGTSEGTPQGSVLSPLLANLYLHEFDCWWWETYGKLKPHQKAKRRQTGLGNCILARYADDFVLLCNGPRVEAERLREEARQVLWEKLRLELSLEKTRITHVTDGFDFLGFHLQWKLPKSGKPWLRVTPSQKSIERFKRTVKAMTRRNTLYQSPLEKIQSLNRVMRGWNQYYEYVNATATVRQLTYWANGRLFVWLKKRHQQGARWVLRTYRKRERCGHHDRWNFGVKDETGQTIYLYMLTDLHRRVYYPRQHPHPHLTPAAENQFPDAPFPAFWEGQTTPEGAEWAVLRLAALARDGYHCTECGSPSTLQVHHRQARQEGGTDQMDNLQTLCETCHARTPNWGRRPAGSTQSGRAV